MSYVTVSNPFKKATREQVRLRMAICGPAGSGKSFTALRLLAGLCKKIAVINTESGAIQKYLGLAPDGVPFDFDVVELSDFSPRNYVQMILAAGQAGYDGLLIDSLSHAWAGTGGALDMLGDMERKAKQTGKGFNSFTAWKDVTPEHNHLVDAQLKTPCHLVATMRTKTDFVMEEFQDNSGVTRTRPKRVGLKSIQRDGMEYEFDVVADMDVDHVLTISKTRCMELDGKSTIKPGVQFFQPLYRWLTEGEDIPQERFAVTEADLTKLEMARLAEKTGVSRPGSGGVGGAAAQPEKPRKSAKELAMEAAAAMSNATAPALAVAPPQPVNEDSEPDADDELDGPIANGEPVYPSVIEPPTADHDGYATAQLVNAINNMYVKHNISYDRQKKKLEDLKAPTLRSVKFDVALDIYNKLRKAAGMEVATVGELENA